MDALFLLPSAVARSVEVDAWFASDDPVRRLGEPWFARLRACGPDVRELIHDGHPTACVEAAAFAYLDAFSGHANLGFFHGADLPDPHHLLQGTGRRMRRVKLRWGEPVDEGGVAALIAAAYADVRRRLAAAG